MRKRGVVMRLNHQEGNDGQACAATASSKAGCEPRRGGVKVAAGRGGKRPTHPTRR